MFQRFYSAVRAMIMLIKPADDSLLFELVIDSLRAFRYLLEL